MKFLVGEKLAEDLEMPESFRIRSSLTMHANYPMVDILPFLPSQKFKQK